MAAWGGRRAELVESYVTGRTSFIPLLLPEVAVGLSTADTLAILRGRLGEALDDALAPENADPGSDPRLLPPSVASPVAGEETGAWLRDTNMVGINVRTIGSHWNVVKYALTLPEARNSIHLLPIWEPGVVESLYGISSWELNPEFFSEELAQAVPTLDRVDRQVRAVVNVLHAMGKTVGMDVIPHTDRFSEVVMAQPHLFEWLRRRGGRMVAHGGDLADEVRELIYGWLGERGPARDEDELPVSAKALFAMPESKRLRLLFGLPQDREGRVARRVDLLRRLYREGIETVPATMAPPFRGIEIVPGAPIVDEQGFEWRDFQMTEPTHMSRVFNPLARYQLYEAADDEWALDFARPRIAAWDYVCARYADVQRRFNFDFMRGDMSHVQMRPAGVPAVIDRYYDLLAAVKDHIRGQAPHFAYHAESFLAPRDVFGYGEEIDHLEAAQAEVALGDLQSTAVTSAEFHRRFRFYLDMLATRGCAPCFTALTPDKDDPRFDEFFRTGGEARLFCSLFITDMPSYTALGAATRDVHAEPVANERYTKLFVFREHGDSNIYPSKARFSDDFIWGRNGELFRTVTRIRLLADDILPGLGGRPVRWLLAPDATGERQVIAWTQADKPDYLFVVNFGAEPVPYLGVPTLGGPGPAFEPVFTTAADQPPPAPVFTGVHHRFEGVGPGECRAYAVTS